MPFKSEAQRRKFGEMVQKGEMTQEQFDEWNQDTPHKIPERVPGKGKPIRSIEQIKEIAKNRGKR